VCLITYRYIPGNRLQATPGPSLADILFVKTIVNVLLPDRVRQYLPYWAVFGLCLCSAHLAHAGIKSCTLADGSTVFQDTPCVVIPKTNADASPKPKAVPFGIEKTWFDVPDTNERAFCTATGCDCGDSRRQFENGLPLAIADALYLDGSWHRLEATLSQMQLSTTATYEYEDLMRERDEAACNILMSQKTLRMFGADVLAQLRDSKRYAEDMGLDDPEDCEAGQINVCEHIDNIDLYKRISSDIRALTRTSRNNDNTVDETNANELDILDAKISAERKNITDLSALPFDF